MSERLISSAFWRCDADGETYQAVVSVIAHDLDGNEAEPPDGVDVRVDSVPCPICGEPMRRVVSLVDARDWEAQFA